MATKKRVAEGVKGYEDADVFIEDQYVLAVSKERKMVANRSMPLWLEFTIDGFDEPDSFLRIELRDDVPRLVELAWVAYENQSEIRPKHLREVDLAACVDMLYGMWVIEMRDGKAVTNTDPIGSEQDRRVRAFFEEQRQLQKGRRPITDELCRHVATVYRENIATAPTQAVARVFGVKSRMASRYVDEARSRGYLSPTTQGMKKA